MSTRKCAAICIPICCFTLALAIALPIVSNFFSPTLNTVFGEGELKTDNTGEVDANYYENVDTSESLKQSIEGTLEVTSEGLVLLKNNDCLPLSSSETIISPFGYGYFNVGTTGGSSSWNGVSVQTKSLRDGVRDLFTINTDIEDLTWQACQNAVTSLSAPNTEPDDIEGVNNYHRVLKSNAFNYEGKGSSCNNTIGLMVVTRDGIEGLDLKMDAYSDGAEHALQLTGTELETLKFINTNCKKTILVTTANNILEINDEVEQLCDAIIYMPYPGAGGAEVLGKVLSGTINPSGRTVDTWSKDFSKIPANQNFGFSAGNYATLGDDAMTYKNVEQLDGTSKATFIQYEEGIYVGYRYYETAYEEALKGNYVGFDYESEVQYPFGHGLSYTTFEQKFVSSKVEDEKVKLSIEVTNTGSTAGKEAVQIYYGAPYTDFDKINGIEKASKNLIAFDKSRLLKPGASETIDLEFNIEDMASYFYKHENSDGTKGCYFLEAGTYNIYLGKSAHEQYETYSYTVSNNVFYDNNNPRFSEKEGQAKLDKEGEPTNSPKDGDSFIAATNLFQSSSDFMNEEGITNFSRSDFANTYPTIPTDDDRTLKDVYKEEFDSYKSSVMDIKEHPVLGNQKGSKARDLTPFEIIQKDIVLSALRGKDYNDSMWDDLLNEISFRSSTNRDQLGKLLAYGAFNTGKLDAIGKFSTQEYDGPMGVSTFGAKKDWSWCSYTTQILVACTFNPRLAYERGKDMGQELLANGVQGLYAPGLNLHRSPFCGRNGEYTSEDPLLTGVIASNIISGAADGGIYMYMKHFALNEQESNRLNMPMTWANEQVIRELYLKAFEIPAKTARQKLYYWDTETQTKEYKIIRGCSAVMTSFNCIGPVMASQNWSLNTGVLRNEWGFEGMVITDYGPKVELDPMIRSGNDFYLTAFSGMNGQSLSDVFSDSSSITALHAIRRAVKNICYAQVNSGTFNGIAPNAKSYRTIAAWEIWINYVLTGTLYVITIGVASLVPINYLMHKKDRKKQPSIDDTNDITTN